MSLTFFYMGLGNRQYRF